MGQYSWYPSVEPEPYNKELLTGKVFFLDYKYGEADKAQTETGYVVKYSARRERTFEDNYKQRLADIIL